jgi:hypothetical protein
VDGAHAGPLTPLPPPRLPHPTWQYFLYFVNCAGEVAVSWTARIAMYNLRPDGGRDYLSVGETELSTLYWWGGRGCSVTGGGFPRGATVGLCVAASGGAPPRLMAAPAAVKSPLTLPPPPPPHPTPPHPTPILNSPPGSCLPSSPP